MICVVCGCEVLRVTQSPNRTDKTDIRKVQCTDCAQEYYTETKLGGLIEQGNYIPLADAKILIEQKSDEYLNKKTKYIKFKRID